MDYDGIIILKIYQYISQRTKVDCREAAGRFIDDRQESFLYDGKKMLFFQGGDECGTIGQPASEAGPLPHSI